MNKEGDENEESGEYEVIEELIEEEEVVEDSGNQNEPEEDDESSSIPRAKYIVTQKVLFFSYM